jgi:hypothetical protein
MNSLNSSKKINVAVELFNNNNNGYLKSLLVILLFLLIIGIFSYIIYKKLYKPFAIKIPTTANMKEVLEKRKKELKLLYEEIDRKKSLIALPTNQNFLVNYHTLFQDYAGYLGPYSNGIIDPVSAITLSMSCGARGFKIYIEDIDGKPMIIIRNSEGTKLSMNDVHISEVIDAIAGNIFNESIEGRANLMRDDPCIIYLKFKGKPSTICAESVANALNKYRHLLISVNEKGDFTHRKNENKLFLLTPTDVARKIIILCNVETDEFKGKGTMKPGLDYFINGRVWNYNELQKNSAEIRFIYEITEEYLKQLNDDGIVAIKKDARLKYFIVNGEGLIEKNKELGMQGMCGFTFDFKKYRDGFSKGTFAKIEKLRYIVPEPMQITPAPKEMNSNGGIIQVPTFI